MNTRKADAPAAADQRSTTCLPARTAFTCVGSSTGCTREVGTPATDVTDATSVPQPAAEASAATRKAPVVTARTLSTFTCEAPLGLYQEQIDRGQPQMRISTLR